MKAIFVHKWKPFPVTFIQRDATQWSSHAISIIFACFWLLTWYFLPDQAFVSGVHWWPNWAIPGMSKMLRISQSSFNSKSVRTVRIWKDFLQQWFSGCWFTPHLSWGNKQIRAKISDGRLRSKCDGTRAETRFYLLVKRTSPFKLAVASVQSTTGSRGVRISGSNAGYTMFRGSVKGTGYPLHSAVSLSLPLPCVTVCHHISAGL